MMIFNDDARGCWWWTGSPSDCGSGLGTRTSGGCASSGSGPFWSSLWQRSSSRNSVFWESGFSMQNLKLVSYKLQVVTFINLRCLPICCRLQCCQEGEGWLKGGGGFLHRARMSVVELQHSCCRGLEWVSSFQKLPGWIASGGGGGGAQLQRWFQKVNFPVKPDKTPGPHSCAIIVLHISTQNHFRQKLTI